MSVGYIRTLAGVVWNAPILAGFISIALVVVAFITNRSSAINSRNVTSGTAPWILGCKIPASLQSITIKNLESCRAVIRSDWRKHKYANFGPRLTVLEARAGPNRRLIETFQIDNAFTTINEEHRKDFRAQVIASMTTEDNDWASIATFGRLFLQTHLAHARAPISVVPMIQTFVLRVVLLKFCDVGHGVDPGVLQGAADKINKLWLASKQVFGPNNVLEPTMIPVLRGQLLGELQTILRDYSRNPLNVILPAYETLWRIVLRLFLETRFRANQDHAAFRASFHKFAWEYSYNFNPHAIGHADEDDTEDIVREGLRLYPPTRRIYRWCQTKSADGTLNPWPSQSAADIEALHRDPTIWGDDALEFKPSRWKEAYGTTKWTEMNAAYMPFGYGRLSCPAEKEFGPRMIAVLLAVLHDIYGDDGWKVESETGDEIDKAGPLDNGREGYSTLKISQGH